MNSLLIYNKNVATNLFFDFEEKELGSTYAFQIGKQELLNPNFSIDKKIDDALKSEIDNCKYDCIFIPYSLSEENYIEFLGLRFACHIRLTQEFNNIQTPIIFFGYESESDLNKLSELGAFLFTKGVYTTKKVSIQNFKKQIEFVSETYEKIDNNIFLKDFTKRVSISTSGNYSTHHSITNLWSIYRWAKALGLGNEYLKEIEKKIDNDLYFKYLKAQFPVKVATDAKNQIIFKPGRILHIDDEINKGWDIIFKKICSNPNIKYNSIGVDFKNMNDSNQIIESVLNKVNEFGPDVILLDYRLHDDDFETSDPECVTGYKILQKIKKANKGIQVIILSATNKIWNLLRLQETGANNFILKESPQLSIDENYSKNAISEIYKSINDSLEHKYLKEIFSKLTPLVKHVGILNTLDPKKYSKKEYRLPQGKISNNLDLLKSCEALLLAKKPELKFAFLQLILIIEDIVKTFYLGDDIRVGHFVEKSISEKIYVLKEEYSKLHLRLEPVTRWSYFKDIGDTLHKISSNDDDYKHLNKKSDSVLFNYRLNCVIHFAYNINLDESAKFSELYRKRSQLSHSNDSLKVKPKEIVLAIELLEIFFDKNRLSK
jgi:CheY-like chemotaxis protein